MEKNTKPQLTDQKYLDGFIVEILSIGKQKNHPELNEDGFVATAHTFAVIDGSAPRTTIKFSGKSSAQFATDVLKDVFTTTPPTLNGIKLVAKITAELNEKIDTMGLRDIVIQTPEAKPAALFVCARIVNGKLIITALGDIACRVNGKIIHNDHILSENLMVEKRVKTMEDEIGRNKNISDDKLCVLGKAAIVEDLKTQVKEYFNNPDDPLGIGIIDGNNVPDKFIKTYEFNTADVKTLEIFSDGYYAIPKEPTIEAFEKAFLEAEKEDPLRFKKYPAVKASTPEQFSDDRTILIAKN